MLAVYQEIISRKKIVLGSQSAQRRRILGENLGLSFTCVKSDFAEDIDKSSVFSTEEYVRQTCLGKLNDLIENHARVRDADVVVCADTVIEFKPYDGQSEGSIYEKPRDRDHAIDMLCSLTGRTHRVLTGVCIALRDKDRKLYGNGNESDNSAKRTKKERSYTIKAFVEATSVTFAELDRQSITAYVDTNEHFGKAGGYGLQSLGSSLCNKIEGCYFNVMGFPAHRFAREFIGMIADLSLPCPDVNSSVLREIGKQRYKVWEDVINKDLFPSNEYLDEGMDFELEIGGGSHFVIRNMVTQEIVASARSTIHTSPDDPYRDLKLWKDKGISLNFPVMDFGRLCVNQEYRRRGCAYALNVARMRLARQLKVKTIICTASKINAKLLKEQYDFKDIIPGGIEIKFDDRPSVIFNAIQCDLTY